MTEGAYSTLYSIQVQSQLQRRVAQGSTWFTLTYQREVENNGKRCNLLKIKHPRFDEFLLLIKIRIEKSKNIF